MRGARVKRALGEMLLWRVLGERFSGDTCVVSPDASCQLRVVKRNSQFKTMLGVRAQSAVRGERCLELIRAMATEREIDTAFPAGNAIPVRQGSSRKAQEGGVPPVKAEEPGV